MSTAATYMRSGNHLQYLHRSTCTRYGFLARLLHKVKPWPWADEQDQPTLRRLTAALDIKHCPTCRPLAQSRRSSR